MPPPETVIKMLAACLNGCNIASVRGEMPLRALGSTGELFSVIGLGGFHIGANSLGSAESVRIIRTALERGLTFLDNSWDYNDGASERRMGRAFVEWLPAESFCDDQSVDGRTKKEAARQINQSLRRLGVDYIDLLAAS